MCVYVIHIFIKYTFIINNELMYIYRKKSLVLSESKRKIFRFMIEKKRYLLTLIVI